MLIFCSSEARRAFRALDLKHPALWMGFSRAWQQTYVNLGLAWFPQKVAPFNLDAYVAGKSPKWTQWDCDPSTFPWEYDSVTPANIALFHCAGSTSDDKAV